MKFVCPQSELNAHLSLASRVVPSRPSKPVLSNVLLKADASTGMVTLIGFDETLGIETSFQAAVDADGELTLPAKLLENIVSRLPSEDIAIEEMETDAAITLTSSSGEYQVRGLSAEDYPSLPLVEDGQAAKISAEALLEGLRGVLFATSPDEAKQVLTGVHLLSEADVLEFAATDGHRLAVVKTSDESAQEEGAIADQPLVIDVTVPAKAMRELEKMLQGYASSDPISLRLDRTQVIFEIGHQKLTTRLLEGQYPNYPQLIPQQFERQVTVDRKQFTSALERIAVLADQRNNLVKISLDDTQQSLALSVEAQEVGRGREVLPAQITGEALDIAFNVRYLLDGLKALGTNEVQMQCNSATSPSVLIPLGELQMIYLVMPVQIRA
ncbi:MAG: DNA polymerase III subunit beta [Leptolyngbyaceae cyanobacterium T60_A2020_046]|nr:DNA polymerase III subunit beta [Leptolyngbyaceae cyanobacterium T60_A2020_046]